ncbi:pyridoxal phosphate-dependent aminotransferase [Microlunatus capsulatus]|uniref:Aminotransferase n=1 Tax=Microlunatus capsulatus TaxID=99117 RepID=A0ABS4Z2N5_9ACTN|nr:pyridoxal phosphate-dependent aminotransferase [Microlunatus capsulatus]MBP2415244.1 aspartate/methionine/tyrosine aminotransferase [Microlunatus capsulatus]
MSGRGPGSATSASVAPSGIRAIADLAWRTPGALQLQIGEPSAPTPPHVVEAMTAALRDGATRYGPTAGLPLFREAAVEKLRRVNGLDASPDDVTVCAGGVEGLGAVYRALLDAGDEVLVPDPGWPNLVGLALLVDARPVRYPLLRDGRVELEPAVLEALRTPRTRVLVLNSPSNPTGGGLDADQLEPVLAWAAEHGVVVVSDECYDEMWLDAPQPCTAAVAAAMAAAGRPVPVVVSVFSLSKTHAMTGFRLGYVLAPAELTPLVRRVQETQLSCVATPTQWAGAAALTGPQDHVAAMRAEYRDRRDRCVAVLAGRPELVLAAPPVGAFYLWLRYAADVHSGTLAVDLLRDHGVALAPGTAFGPAGEGHLRISLATATDVLLEGLDRVLVALR